MKHKKRPYKLKDYEKTHQIAIRFVKPHLHAPTSPQYDWTSALESLERTLEQEELNKKRETQYAINILIHTVILVLAGIGLFYLITLI